MADEGYVTDPDPGPRFFYGRIRVYLEDGIRANFTRIRNKILNVLL